MLPSSTIHARTRTTGRLIHHCTALTESHRPKASCISSASHPSITKTRNQATPMHHCPIYFHTASFPPQNSYQPITADKTYGVRREGESERVPRVACLVSRALVSRSLSSANTCTESAQDSSLKGPAGENHSQRRPLFTADKTGTVMNMSALPCLRCL